MFNLKSKEENFYKMFFEVVRNANKAAITVRGVVVKNA